MEFIDRHTRDLDVEEWDDLMTRIASPNIFFSHWFLRAWQKSVGVDHKLVNFLIRKNNKLVGVIPIVKENSNLKLGGDPNLFDYQDLVIEKGMETEVINVLFDYLAKTKWTTLELPSVPQDSLNTIALMEISKQRNYSIKLSECGVAPIAQLPDSWESFVASLRKKHRHELRRKIRRIENKGEVKQVSLSKPLDQDISEFFKLMKLTSQAKSSFLTPNIEKFFRSLIQEASSNDCVHLSFLEFNNRRVAGCLVFDYQGEFMLYNSGYDSSNRELSAGLINKAYTIKEAISLQKSRFNFLKGSERYKYELGGLDTLINNVLIIRN